jgi:hypothetical protein
VIWKDLVDWSSPILSGFLGSLDAFCSKSNRVARGDACAGRAAPCSGCAPTLCPFATSMGGADALAS